MTGTKRIYVETEKDIYNQRRAEIERFGYEKAFGVPSYEKYEHEKNNNKVRGEW